MNVNQNYNLADIAKIIISFCISTNRKFIFISGNGGSGKTEFSKILAQEVESYGHFNLLEMDDFLVDTKLRNSATAFWSDIEKRERKGRYTTSLPDSYFLQNVKAILYNLEQGNNYYHWPRKALGKKEARLLNWDAILTIVEGIGTVFLDKHNSINIFIHCTEELEIARRIKRRKFSNEKTEKEVHEKFDERNSQYKAYVEPHKLEHDLVLKSTEDYSVYIEQDSYDILSKKISR